MNALTTAEAKFAAECAHSAYLDSYTRDTRQAEEWCTTPTISLATQQAFFVWEGLDMHYKRLLEEEDGIQAKKLRMQVRRVRRRLYRRMAS